MIAGHAGSMGMMMMQMYFTASTHVTLWLKQWHTHSSIWYSLLSHPKDFELIAVNNHTLHISYKSFLVLAILPLSAWKRREAIGTALFVCCDTCSF